MVEVAGFFMTAGRKICQLVPDTWSLGDQTGCAEVRNKRSDRTCSGSIWFVNHPNRWIMSTQDSYCTPSKRIKKGGLACNYWFWSYRDSVGLAGLGWFGNHRCFQRQTQFHIQQPKGLGRWPIKTVGHGCSPHMLWEVLSPHSVLESSHPQDRNETFSPFLFVLEFWVW